MKVQKKFISEPTYTGIFRIFRIIMWSFNCIRKKKNFQRNLQLFHQNKILWRVLFLRKQIFQNFSDNSFICFSICLDLSNNNLSYCCCFWRVINFKISANAFGEIFFCLNWDIDLKTSRYRAQYATKKFRW